MRVRFDLRPAEFLEQERKRRSFSVVRLLAVALLLSFMTSSGFYIVLAFIETQALHSDIAVWEGDLAGLETSQTALAEEITRLKAREEQFKKTLEIMQSESPALEVLSALETHMEPGMKVNAVRFFASSAEEDKSTEEDRSAEEDKTVSYKVTVDAAATAEEQIIALTDGLSGSGLFSTVTMPSTQKDEQTGRVSFVLTLVARPFGEAAAGGGRP